MCVELPEWKEKGKKKKIRTETLRSVNGIEIEMIKKGEREVNRDSN